MTDATFDAPGCRFTPRAACRARHAAGFSFTELLFAVMILGIGFILVAAIFPVGLAQTKSNFDETHAASLARSAAAEIGRMAYDADFMNTNVTPLQQPSGTNATTLIANANMLSPSDPRYAWVGLYRRVSPTSKTAQLMLFVVGRSQPFQPGDMVVGGNAVRVLEPRPVELNVNGGVFNVDNLTTTNGNGVNSEAAAPGSFILIGNDNLSDAGARSAIFDRDDPTNSALATAAQNAVTPGFLNGRVFRLGAQNGKNFEGFPGSEFDVTFEYDHDGNPSTATRTAVVPVLVDAYAYIVGRNRIGDSGNAGQDFDGGTMDVAYYTTFISLK